MAADIQVIVDPAEIVASVTINTGAPGATGPQGIQGPQGLKGDQGIQGPQGVQGERGLQGIQGLAGVNGTNGSDASVTAANIESALGYVPADAENVGNPFDQELDTTDSPSFSKLNITGSGTSDSTFKVGSLEFQPFAVNNCWFGDNIFYGPTGFKLRNNGSAGAFYFQGSNSGGLGEEGQFRLTSAGLQGDTVSPSVQMKISHTGQFGVGSAISTATGNFSGASFYVDASGNLTAANFTPDDYLTDASQFAPASHTHPLSALTQSSATTGQVATWNGSSWVPTTPASGGGGGGVSSVAGRTGAVTLTASDVSDLAKSIFQGFSVTPFDASIPTFSGGVLTLFTLKSGGAEGVTVNTIEYNYSDGILTSKVLKAANGTSVLNTITFSYSSGILTSKILT